MGVISNLILIIGALIAHVFFPLFVCIVNFKINSKVFVFVNVYLSVSLEIRSAFGATCFQGTLEKRALVFINDIHKEVFPISNIVGLSFRTGVIKLVYTWVFNQSFLTNLQWLRTTNLTFENIYFKCGIANSILTVYTYFFCVARAVGSVRVEQNFWSFFLFR